MANTSTSVLEMQAQIFAVLKADAQLSALMPVMDFVPEGTDRPYVELGEIEEVVANVFGKRGRNVTAILHVYSEAPGFLEVERVVERLNTLLDVALPDTLSWHCIDGALVILSLVKEFDVVEIRHVTASYLFQVEQLP